MKLNFAADTENLTVKISWNVSTTVGEKFMPEKMILLYSESNQPYRFVNKYRNISKAELNLHLNLMI
jgi:hypothetical protein